MATVLIVDDLPINRDLMRTLLTHHGHRVLEAGDGVEAPTSVPVQYPHAAVRELATFAPSGCTGGCGSGSTIGPDRALYVTDGKRGRVLRIDPRTGAQTTFAHGLPRSIDSVGKALETMARKN